MNLFNTDWKNYISKGEKVTLMTQISNKVAFIQSLVSSLIGAFILFILASIVSIDYLKKIPEEKIIMYLASIYGVLFILFLICTYLTFKSKKYVITNKGILEIKGVFEKSYKLVPFIKITDTRLHRNIFDLMFGTGSIYISTAGGTRYEMRFLHVDDFMKVNEQVKKSIK